MLDKEFQSECEIRTIISVDYRSIESLIDRHFKTQEHKYGFELPCVEERGSGDGEDWEISISKEELSEYHSRYFKPDSNGNWCQFSTVTLLTELCNRDIIPAGNYLISISW